MKYVCLDLETTGLNAETCQILEIGAVFEDLENPLPLAELPRFHAYVEHEEIRGNAFALAMNHEIIRRIAKKEKGYKYIKPADVLDKLQSWFEELGLGKVTLGGKNVARFDMPFLDKLPKWLNYPTFTHRVVDVGPMYLRRNDDFPPDLKTCMLRAGFSEEESIVKHDAIGDALQVIKCVRRHFDMPL